MTLFFKDLYQNRILWLLVFVPLPLIVSALSPQSETLVFLLSVLAIIPLAALLSLSTEQIAARTGDSAGGLLNATLGNLTELIITIAALRAGDVMLVKASLVGVIIANTLFMMGASFLLGGLKHHVQNFSMSNAKLQVSMLFLAAFALLVPSAIADTESRVVPESLSVVIAIILLVTYILGLLFTLGTHRQFFAGGGHDEAHHEVWPVPVALAVMAATTVCVAIVSELFVESVETAGHQLGLSSAFVGIVVVALVGGAAEMVAAFSAARKNRLDVSVAIAFGSAVQIALFVTPVLLLLSFFIGPAPIDLIFWPGAVIMVFVATLTAALVASGGQSAWFIGTLMLMIYAVFAATLYILPPAVNG